MTDKQTALGPEREGDAPGDASSDDRAWVTIDTPLSMAELEAFIEDTERLLRINSLYTFKTFQSLGNNRFQVHIANHSNGKELETGITAERTADGVVLHYADGLKSRTLIKAVPSPAFESNSRLVLTEYYDRFTEQERRSRIEEVDRSLDRWGRDLYRYLRHWKRWSRFSPWRCYMERVWQPMRPMARRITFMLIVITLAEIVIFFMIVAVFKLELDRFLQL